MKKADLIKYTATFTDLVAARILNKISEDEFQDKTVKLMNDFLKQVIWAHSNTRGYFKRIDHVTFCLMRSISSG